VSRFRQCGEATIPSSSQIGQTALVRYAYLRDLQDTNETLFYAVLARNIFAAVQGKDRRFMKEEVLASQNGITVKFTGEQLNPI
jgi:hypothetical protein